MAQNPEFKYAPMFQLGEDKTEYYLLTKDYVSEGEFEGHKIVKVQPEALTMLSKQCFHDANFLLRRAHNEQVAKILKDPEASENDKYVALTFLRNAESAAKGILPLCQDTGLGLGVTIASALAEANGGQIQFKARPEGGLIAVVTLLSAASLPENASRTPTDISRKEF